MRLLCSQRIALCPSRQRTPQKGDAGDQSEIGPMHSDAKLKEALRLAGKASTELLPSIASHIASSLFVVSSQGLVTACERNDAMICGVPGKGRYRFPKKEEGENGEEGREERQKREAGRRWKQAEEVSKSIKIKRGDPKEEKG